MKIMNFIRIEKRRLRTMWCTVAGGSSNLLEAARILLEASSRKTSLTFCVYSFVPCFRLVPLWTIFFVSKEDCSNRMISERCGVDSWNIRQTQRCVNNINCVWLYSDKFRDFSWTANVIIHNVPVALIFYFGAWVLKNQYYAINCKGSWIRVLKFL